MEQRREKTALIISALIHLILLMLFLFGAFKKSTLITFITPDRKKAKQRMMQSALIPKRSDKGTKIFFDNSTILPTPPIAHRSSRVAPSASRCVGVVSRETNARATAEPNKVTPKKETIKTKVFPKKIAPTKPKTTLEKPIDIKKLVTKNITKRASKKEIKKVVEKKPQPKKSLLSLTKCFLDSDKGNSCMCRRGENRMPDFEEMKYICYEKQIQDQLVIAWRALYSGRPPVMVNRETRFSFIVNEHCKAEQVEIIVSSGNRTFDNMVLESVQSAIFPPIPKHFGVKKYRPRGGTVVLR